MSSLAMTREELAKLGRVVVDGRAVTAAAPTRQSRQWPVLASELPRPSSLATERIEQGEVVKVFQRFGCRVESTSQYRRSKVALGLPDLWFFCPPGTLKAGWFETKSGADWRFSGPQLEWAERCLATATPYGCGDRFAAETFCRALGLKER